MAKIIVTGAGGFLGKNTVKYLRDKGHDVTSFTQDVKRNLPYESFDCLYHFAAYVGGRKGIDNNKWLVTENIEIDRITFRWAEEWCKKIIYPSSCAAYPMYLQEMPNTPMHEEQFGSSKTFDLYGLAKLVAESMLKTLDIPVHIMRPFQHIRPWTRYGLSAAGNNSKSTARRVQCMGQRNTNKRLGLYRRCTKNI